MENSDSALIIVDVQNDFMEKGSLEVPKANQILPCINSLRKKFKTVFVTQDYHPKNHISFANIHKVEPFSVVKTSNGDQLVYPAHCIQGTWGCEFHKDLERDESDILIQKGIYEDIDSYTGFGTAPEKTKLDELLKLKGVKKVFIVGLCFDICVKDTSIDAVNLGYGTYIVKEGTIALNEKGEKETIELLKQKNIKYISLDEIEKYF